MSVARHCRWRFQAGQSRPTDLLGGSPLCGHRDRKQRLNIWRSVHGHRHVRPEVTDKMNTVITERLYAYHSGGGYDVY